MFADPPVFDGKSKGKGKSKCYPRTGQEGPEVQFYFFLNLGVR